MLIPPALFLSFGIPPASSPPNWGAASIPPPLESPPPTGLLGWSLLLLPLFPLAGGRRPATGTGGAPPIGGPDEAEVDLLSMIGADRSLTWATFLSRAPFSISPSSAP